MNYEFLFAILMDEGACLHAINSCVRNNIGDGARGTCVYSRNTSVFNHHSATISTTLLCCAALQFSEENY